MSNDNKDKSFVRDVKKQTKKELEKNKKSLVITKQQEEEK